jgi:hypothetical protein
MAVHCVHCHFSCKNRTGTDVQGMYELPSMKGSVLPGISKIIAIFLYFFSFCSLATIGEPVAMKSSIH